MAASSAEYGPTAVVQVQLERALAPLELPSNAARALLVVRLGAQIVGHAVAAAASALWPQDQRAAIATQLSSELDREVLRAAFRKATRAANVQTPSSRELISVVVTALESAAGLDECLQSVQRLNTPPHEILVTGSAPEAAETCRHFGLPFYELTRRDAHPLARAADAANGALLAVTDASCTVEPGWLDGAEAFSNDPLLAVVAGYVGPHELETPAQWLFERHSQRADLSPHVFDMFANSPVLVAPAVGSLANAICRAEALRFEDAGGAAATTRRLRAAELWLFYRVLAGGYRVAFSPSSVVWRRHPRSLEVVHRLMADDAADVSAFAAACLSRLGELDAARLLRSSRGLKPRMSIGGHGLGARAERSRESSFGPVRESPPSVSVIIPTRNRRDRLVAVLRGFAAQRYPVDRFEVIVVDDGSTDGTPAVARLLQVPYSCRVVVQEHRGVATARNRGAEEGTKPILIFVDDDIVPTRDFVAEHADAVAAAWNEPLVIAGYSRPRTDATGFWPTLVRNTWEDYFRDVSEPDYQWTFADYPGGNASLRRDLFVSVGGFDEAFSLRRQDAELGVRMLARGVRLAHSRAAWGDHFFDPSFSTAMRISRNTAIADVALGRKYPQLLGRLHLVGLLRPGPRAMSARAALAFRLPRLTTMGSHVARGPLAVYEAAHLRRRWLALASRLLAHAYVIGLREALPTFDAYCNFMRPLEQPGAQHVCSVILGHTGSLRLPSPIAPVSLSIEYRGRALGVVPAMSPGGHWQWQQLEERVLTGLADAAPLDSDEVLALAASLSDEHE